MKCKFCHQECYHINQSRFYLFSKCLPCNVNYAWDVDQNKLDQYYYQVIINKVFYKFVIHPQFGKSNLYQLSWSNEKLVMHWNHINDNINPNNIQEKLKLYLTFS